MRTLRALAIALACAPTIALAQAATTDTAATHRQAAEQLLTITGTQQMLATMQTQALEGTIAQAPQLRQFEGSLREYFREQLDWAVLEPEYVKIYVDVFTEQELRDVTAFYQTPLGQKLLARLPDLMRRSQAMAAARLQASLPKLIERMQREAEAQQKQGAPSAPPASQPRPKPAASAKP